MTRDTPEDQLREVREQLNLQGEAILKLVEVLSGLEGVEAAALATYATRVQRLRTDSGVAPGGDARATDSPHPPPDPTIPTKQPEGLISPDDQGGVSS